MKLLRRIAEAVSAPARQPAEPPLTGHQHGLVKAASIGRLWLDPRNIVAYHQVNAAGDLVNVTPDVAVLMGRRFLYHDFVDLSVPPEMRPRLVQYHPTAKGEDLLMAAAQRKKKGSRRD